MTSRSLVAIIPAVVLVVGCSGGGPTGNRCPTTIPAAGGACPIAVDRCSYGETPLLDCRTYAVCTATGWQVTPPPGFCSTGAAGCAPVDPNAPICAAPSPACVVNGVSICSCTPCQCETPHPPGAPCPDCPPGQPQGTPVWFCRSALAPSAPCPSVVPNLGATCPTEGQKCPSNACAETIATCMAGTWHWSTDNRCPVCASPETPIATPDGERRIGELRVGDLVYTVENGTKVAAPIAFVRRTPVLHHRVVRVVLESGRTLEISAGHPTADGRTFADLRLGDRLDGQLVVAVEHVPYRFAFTYDIRPASPSGTYFAAGALIGSTLRLEEGAQ